MTVTMLVISGLAGFFYVTYWRNHGHQQSDLANACEVSVCVNLGPDTARPNSLSVKKDDTVRFASNDGKNHSLSLGEGGSKHSHAGKLSSGSIGAHEAWEVRFDKEGSYYFHDHDNPGINVLVVVYTPGKSYRIDH